jgi:hypothetical protein
MFPDFHWRIEDGIITNDKIVARFRVTATHDHRPVCSRCTSFPSNGQEPGLGRDFDLASC